MMDLLDETNNNNSESFSKNDVEQTTTNNEPAVVDTWNHDNNDDLVDILPPPHELLSSATVIADDTDTNRNDNQDIKQQKQQQPEKPSLLLPSPSITTTTTLPTNNNEDNIVSASANKPQQHQQTKPTQPPQIQQPQHNSNNNNNNNNALIFAENEALKEKVNKLKGLLGRSAKAQRETKMELDAMTKKYQELLEQNNHMQHKIEKLSNRPTHMEMLADFETNFDRALLSIGSTAVTNAMNQSGGKETSPATNDRTNLNDNSNNKNHIDNDNDNNNNYNNSYNEMNDNIGAGKAMGGSVVDTLLMQELHDAKQRIEKLEKLNTTLMERTKHMESDIILQYQRQISDYKNTIQRLELEKKMATMQYEHSIKDLQQCQSSMEEMTLEIHLLTVAKQKAIDRAESFAQSIQSYDANMNQINQLQQQMNALREWAIASNETKTLAQERVRILEHQLQQIQQQPNHNTLRDVMNTAISSDDTVIDQRSGRIILSKNGSLVVGAGDINYKLLELHEDVVKTILLSERVILRWKFDLGKSSADLDIYFSIMKGNHSNNKSMIEKRCTNKDDCLICHRRIVDGAEGETDHAFALQRSCVIVWNNRHSWIRPKTIKYALDVMVC